MRNADMPAMPWSTAKETEFGPRGHSYQGISKREHLAAMAMQGLVAARPNADYDEIADHAVRHADALLAELEKTQ